MQTINVGSFDTIREKVGRMRRWESWREKDTARKGERRGEGRRWEEGTLRGWRGVGREGGQKVAVGGKRGGGGRGVEIPSSLIL